MPYLVQDHVSGVYRPRLLPTGSGAAVAAPPDLLSNLVLSLDLESNLLDSAPNSYDFTDQGSGPFSTGQTSGYSAKYHIQATADYEEFLGDSGTQIAIADNEWAAHLWVYNGGGSSPAGIFTCASADSFTTGVSDSWALVYASSANKSLQFIVGKEPAALGSVTATSANNAFPASTWVPALIWHDPTDNVIGIKVGSATSVTTAITTGVRLASSTAFTLGSFVDGWQPGQLRIAAVRVWRGAGVIAQVVNNSTALTFLNAQQRRHSELS